MSFNCHPLVLLLSSTCLFLIRLSCYTFFSNVCLLDIDVRFMSSLDYFLSSILSKICRFCEIIVYIEHEPRKLPENHL